MGHFLFFELTMKEGFQHLRYSIHASSGQGRGILGLSVLISPYPRCPSPGVSPEELRFSCRRSPHVVVRPAVPHDAQGSMSPPRLQVHTTAPAAATPTRRPHLGSPAGPGLWLHTSTSGAILLTRIIIIMIIKNCHSLDTMCEAL